MNFSVRSFVRSVAMLIAVVGSTVSANAALVNLTAYNTGATTTKWDAATQVLATVPTNNFNPPADLHYNLTAGGTKTGATYDANNNIGHNAGSTGGSFNWITNSTKSEWVGTSSQGIGFTSTTGAGTYLFSTTFSSSPDAGTTTYRLAGNLSAVGGVNQAAGPVDILIDGVKMATVASVNNYAFKSYDFSTVLAGGTHTLTFKVTTASPTNKLSFNNVFTAATAVVPEPSTFALLGMGAVGMVVAGYRRRRNAV